MAMTEVRNLILVIVLILVGGVFGASIVSDASSYSWQIYWEAGIPGDNFEKHCTCKDWNENTKKINDSIFLYSKTKKIRFYGIESFKHCPYCGKQL